MSASVQSEVLDISGNYAVIKLDQRRFPGIMMQGDTFHNLIQDLEEAGMASSGTSRELMEKVLHTLRAIEGFYEKAIRENGFRMPY